MRPHVFAALAVLLLSPAARASGEHEAEEHFKRGVAFYQETDYKAALVEFRRAYDLSHNFRVLYNVGQAQYQALDYAGALTTFERYLKEGGEKVPRPRQKDVEQEIARLRTRVGSLTIDVAQPGAEISLDQVPIGVAPLPEEVLVGAGVHRVSVTKEGYKPYTGTIEVAGGEAPKLEVKLVALAPEAEPHPAPPPPPPTDGPHREGRRIPWEGWAATGALTLGAAVTGVIALKANGDLDEARGRFGVSSQELSSASSRTKTFSIMSDVFLLGAFVAGGVSLYFTLKPPKSEPARVAVGPGGVSLSGTFR